METTLQILQLFLCLPLLVVIHEFGHYFFARLFKIRVEKFYIFFPPAVFKFKPKNSDTEFGIGCIPLGGFCKIAGMIDESMDKEALAQEPQPWEFRSKPAWQRLLVMFGGVLFNFILAIIIYSAISFTWGESYLKNEDAKYGIEVNQLAYEIGFRNGDKLISIDGKDAPNNFASLQYELVKTQAQQAVVLRDGKEVTIEINKDYLPAMLNNPNMFNIAAPLVVAAIPDTSLNANSGLAIGDKLINIERKDIVFFSEMKDILAQHKDGVVTSKVLRDKDTVTIDLNVSSEGRIEIIHQPDFSAFNITNKEYSLLAAIGAGAKKSVTTLSNYLQELKLIFSPKTEAYKSVGSFITIVNLFPGKWDWRIFWNLTGWLSIMLAVINILPIPALDGGHIIFTLYEMITGKKPSDKFLGYAQALGMILLLMLTFLAFGNDIFRLFN